MKTIRVGYVPYKYFTEVIFGENGTLKGAQGIEIKLLNVLADALNFRYKLVVPADKEWGRKTSNGTWTGIIGLLAREEVDIGVCYLSVSSDRKEAVEFSEPYWNDQLTFVSSYPEEKNSPYVFMQPFYREVWLLLLVSLLSTIIIYSLQTAIYSKSFRTTSSTCLSVLTHLIGLLLRQGVQPLKFLRKTKTRFLIHLWLIVSAVLSSAYCGILLSFMVFPVTERPIHTAEDVLWAVENMGYSVVVEAGSVSEALIKNPDKFKALQALSNAINKTKRYLFKDMDEALDLCLSEKLVFLEVGLPLMMMVYEKGHEKFTVGKETLHSIDTAIAMRKSFEMKNQFNVMIKKINAAGLMNKWIEDEWTKLAFRSSHQQSSNAFFRPLSFTDLKYAFVLIAYFYLVALFLFVIEITLCWKTGRFST